MPGRAFAPRPRSSGRRPTAFGLNPVMPGRAFAPGIPVPVAGMQTFGGVSQSRDARESVRAFSRGRALAASLAIVSIP